MSRIEISGGATPFMTKSSSPKGGVGSFALQIARHVDAEVSATCGAANAEYCRALGAHETIDYLREDFTRHGGFDVVLDSLGGEVHARSLKVLKNGGTLVWLAAAPLPVVEATQVKVVRADVRCTTERLGSLLELAARGAIRVPVETVVPFAEAPRAYALSRSGHARGKIMIQAQKNGDSHHFSDG